MRKIAVLMSTYNGEKFLRQQIESIINQKGRFELKLFVRDDGSKDGTISILKEYEENYGVTWYSGENCGSAASFMQLLMTVEGFDYYAFADQDDVWDANKIEFGIVQMEKKHAALYCANAEIVDQELKSMGQVVYKKKPSTDFNTVLCAGGLLGCTMILKEELAKVIRERKMPEHIIMHDFYVALICGALGMKITYSGETCMKYRQHGNNVVGVSYGFMNKIYDRFKYILQKQKVGIDEQAKDILCRYEDVIKSDKIGFLRDVSNYKKNVWTRFKLAFSTKTRYVNWNKSITLRMAILLGNR